MDCVFSIGPRQPTDPYHKHKANAFTLSYLRRVPELAELARQVARYIRKRKSHDKMEKAKSRASSSSRRAMRIPTVVEKGAADAKMTKQLFIMALRVLYDEGSVVFSNGSGNREWDVEEAEWLQDQEDEIWGARQRGDTHASVTHTTVGPTSITVTMTGNPNRQTIVDDPGLSDPDPEEEAYIPVTPSVLVQPILAAIQSVVIRKGKVAQGGATAAEILEALRGSVDERWARIGDWAIENALEMMAGDEVVWKSAQGRWTVY